MNRLIMILLILSIAVSCNGFLDIVPDNVPVMDHAFTSSVEAEKFLVTCYSYLPGQGDPKSNIGMCAGDEIWLNKIYNNIGAPSWDYIANGKRTPDDTGPDCWQGGSNARPLYIAIRDCNIFLERMQDNSSAPDLTKDKRARWIAEVKFLKAYYHYYLLRTYGPIPIVDKNLPVASTPDEVQVYRQPFDDCVQYISDLLDESLVDLPLVIYNRQSELGRITKPINRAIKARLLLLAASPLFNGNPDYYDVADNRGVKLFPQTYDENKWKLAADAAFEAITIAENAGHKLYYFQSPPFPVTQATMTQMNSRMAVCDRENDEVIWPMTGPSGRARNDLQAGCMAIIDSEFDVGYVRASMAPPMAIVEQFYTKNGVPITEDRTLDFSYPNQLRTAVIDEMVNIQPGYTTARINFDRENRFYACLGFDGGKWLMENHPSRSDVDTYTLECKFGQQGFGTRHSTASTGYFTKKLVHWKSNFLKTIGTGAYEYAFPEIRLAEIYLAYAEALNEYSGPSEDVYLYIDKVRERAGLNGVNESWNRFSNNPSKTKTKEGMREIIRQERMIELALEGHRYWDILRWKLGHKYLNAPIRGWDVFRQEPEAYYQPVVIYNRKFVSPRDYLAPIPNNEINVNRNIVQNPGW